MQLSVIIVNYNVKYFLEQCLCSVVKACTTIDAEIFVVDNASQDGSINYLQPIFPKVNFIVNSENIGFSKANNKALQQCKGDYVLFLNPDTIVPEDCFKNCIHFFKQNESCGGIGVQMLDGSGNFSPESKRSFPSLSSAFFKLVGLSLVFPTSKVFNKYALGNLSKDGIHEIDVLSGAFMMLRKKILDTTKGFDETYFMYGEDIDLSYKIRQNGYKTYYLGTQQIIHFKGESTKRGSLNYVRLFYNAMSIFVKKHYKGGQAAFFVFIINIAIWCRAFISLLRHAVIKSSMLLIDALVVMSSLYITKYAWQHYVNNDIPFAGLLAQYYIPIFTIVFIVGALLSGIYDKLYKPSKAIMASISAVVVMLAVYSLIPENYRFSRGVILIGGIVSGVMVTLVRWLFVQLGWLKDEEAEKLKPYIVVGTQNEQIQVLQLMQKAQIEDKYLGRIAIKPNEENTIGSIENITQILQQIHVKEIVFCEGSLSFTDIFNYISQLKDRHISFRFHAKKSHSVVGSDSKTTTGEIVAAEGKYTIANPYQRRMKRMLDVWVAISIFATFPLQFLFIKNATTAFKNAWLVLIGNKTWVGYSSFQNTLPLLAPAVLTAIELPIQTAKETVNTSVLKKADVLYAKEYDWMQDVRIIFGNYKYLGG